MRPSDSTPPDLKVEHQLVLDLVSEWNTQRQEPASTRQLADNLTSGDRLILEDAYTSPLRVAIAKILTSLSQKAIVASVKMGKANGYYVPSILPTEVCEDFSRPPRRQQVLALTRRAVERWGRGVRASDVVQIAEAERITNEIPPEMIKRDLTNLAQTGELVVIDVVRGDGNGTNLYLPAELDPALFRAEEPLTWLEELRNVFEAMWEERIATARIEGQNPVPPSTTEIRKRFRKAHPGHPKLADPQTLVNGLQQLARTGNPALRPVRRGGVTALVWAPVDVEDDDLDLGAAHLFDTERVAEAARRTLESLRVPVVSDRDVQDTIGLHPELKPAGKQKVYEILADLAKTELSDPRGPRCRRARQSVIRAGVVDGTTYYTVPGTEGVDSYIGLLQVRSKWSSLDAVERVRQLPGCPLPSIRVGQARLLLAECEEISQLAAEARPGLISTAWTRELDEIAVDAKTCAEGALIYVEDGAMDPPETPDRTERGFTPRQLSRLISSRYPLAEGEMSPKRLVPLLDARIRRVENPAFRRRFDQDPETATEYLFEQVESLIYRAFRWGDRQERYFANLATTALGRLRDHRFVVPGLRSARFEERQIAVACLVFLGDPGNDLGRIAETDEVQVVREAAQWGIDFIRTAQEVLS